ncbi:MAG: hypothetical protein NWE83_00405 [Candidatus Bathyarchaeota archaeon]|nr:hypothetical protein [Candidatus Bathyarchaeota archaeon]
MKNTTIEQLVQQIADLYFLSHPSTMKAMVIILHSFGFETIREYDIYLSYDRKGIIDIYARNDLTLGLEFDSRNKIKWKSIDKLDVLKPDIAIFVSGRGSLADQRERIARILQINSPYLYFVSLSDNMYWNREALLAS